jgi:hypothetical protein
MLSGFDYMTLSVNIVLIVQIAHQKDIYDQIMLK